MRFTYYQESIKENLKQHTQSIACTLLGMWQICWHNIGNNLGIIGPMLGVIGSILHGHVI